MSRQASTFKQIELAPGVAEKVVQGDTDAISEAYSVMAQAVMNLSHRMLNDRQLAEEVLQDTFLDLLEKSTQIQDAAAIAGWVRSVAVNHCLMKLRSPWHARRQQTGEDDTFAQHEGMMTQMGETASSAMLQSAMGMLSDDSRTVLWLHEVEGYTHKEIGQLMGKTASFSKSQLARAYDKLMGWRGSLERQSATPMGPRSGRPPNVVSIANCE